MSYEIDVLFNKVFDSEKMRNFGHVPHESLTPQAVHRITRSMGEYKSFDDVWAETFAKSYFKSEKNDVSIMKKYQ